MSEPRTWVKIPLFLSSYFPLWLIFFATLIFNEKYQLLNQFYAKSEEQNMTVIYAAILLGLIIIVSMVVVGLLAWGSKKGNNPKPITVKEREDFTGEYMLYIVTYVIPFLTDDFLEPSRIFALGILMTTIGVLYIRANLFHVNPTLNLFGYKLYKILDVDNNKLLVLSKQGGIRNNSELLANRMAQSIYVDTGKVPSD